MTKKTSAKTRVAVIGASGYTGADLIRLLYNHPAVTIVSLIAESSAGQPIDAVYPHMANFNLPDLIRADEANWSEVDIAFCCLPHGMSQKIIATLPEHIKVIDLSADFRIHDIAVYEEWYGTHYAPELQKKAVYGLSEIYRERIKSASLIACPGCYPTSILLPLVPLLFQQLISPEDIIIDAKSGVSGAGRSAKQANLYCEVNENVKPYSICKHRHMPEIEQVLSKAAGTAVPIHFTPQVVPMSRGMLSSIYVRLEPGHTAADLRETLSGYYEDEPFVHIAPMGHVPSTREVAGSNRCRIGVFEGATPDRAIIISVIDNLLKGASGQAVQNMNILLGLPETTALDMIPLFP